MNHDLSAASARESFERGDHLAILTASLDRGDGRYPAGAARYVIAAAAVMGRVDDAATLFARDGSSLSLEDQAAARFFLAMGLVRVSRYRDAVLHLVKNLALVRKQRLRAEGKFYAYQGAAFYRFFQCRYAPARAAAARAWSMALALGYPYGMAIARDLLAHALLGEGEVTKALEAWADAEERARRLGFGALVDNIRSSVAISRAEHGLVGKATIPELEALVRGFAPQDNFSRASAEIELARWYTLAGRLGDAERLLERAGAVVLTGGNRRSRARLLLRLAYVHLLAGRLGAAEGQVAEAEQAIDPAYDLLHLLAALGIRERLALARGEAPDPALGPRIAALTARTHGGLARNVLWRTRGVGSPTLPGDDPLGDLVHRSTRATGADLAAVLGAGLAGLLPGMLGIRPGARCIALGVLPGRAVLIDAGTVVAGEEPVSDAMRRLLRVLAGGTRSKRELVEQLWGYEYHSLRHDPLVYSLVNRLRSAIQPHGVWLEADGQGYRLASGVTLFEREEVAEVAVAVVRDGAAVAAGPRIAPGAEDSPLNWRQLAILQELEGRAVLGPGDCAAMFNVTRVTASRDFAGLYSLGLVRRIGVGRATRYALRAR